MADAIGNKRYSSKIIKAGALLPDTKLLLETWDTGSDVEDNLERVREENLLGKSSRSRVEDVLRVFRQRYLKDPEMLIALVALVKGGCLSSPSTACSTSRPPGPTPCCTTLSPRC